MPRFSRTVMRVASLLFVLARIATAQSDTTFKPSGTFVGQFFGDYEYKVHADELRRGVGQYSGVAKAYSSFDIRRAYLGYNYAISPDFSTEFLLAYEGNLDGSGNRGIYVKLANVQWKNAIPNADIVFGAQATPSFPSLTESLWGYRSVERTPLDKYKFVGSNDLGIGVRGAFDAARTFGYDVLYGNGTGPAPENDRYKRIYADLWAKLIEKRLVLDLYADHYRKTATPTQDYTTLKAFAAYTLDPITFGVEGFWQMRSNSVFDSVISTQRRDTSASLPFGVAVFVRGPIVRNTLGFFARCDMYDPDSDYEPNGVVYSSGYNSNRELFILAGLDWTPAGAVHILPNVWYTKYSSKIDGAQGSLASDYDLVPRVTVYYKF